jgi:hypothetical protein
MGSFKRPVSYVTREIAGFPRLSGSRAIQATLKVHCCLIDEVIVVCMHVSEN